MRSLLLWWIANGWTFGIGRRRGFLDGWLLFGWRFLDRWPLWERLLDGRLFLLIHCQNSALNKRDLSQHFSKVAGLSIGWVE